MASSANFSFNLLKRDDNIIPLGDQIIYNWALGTRSYRVEDDDAEKVARVEATVDPLDRHRAPV